MVSSMIECLHTKKSCMFVHRSKNESSYIWRMCIIFLKYVQTFANPTDEGWNSLRRSQLQRICMGVRALAKEAGLRFVRECS